MLTLFLCIFTISAHAFTVQSSASIESAESQLHSIRPAVSSPTLGLLGAAGPLGSLGPLGAYGPLGTLGPIGDNGWNASRVFDLLGDWSGLARFYSWNGGPLSEQGPLGPQGPLSSVAYGKELPAMGDFAKQLQLGGIFTVLGPAGALGALGPLGPLGPLGAHGFARAENGDFFSDRKIQRTVRVPYNGGVRTYPLFEVYSQKHAQEMKDQDTSFLVTGDAAESGNYSFQSNDAQYVTALVVPEKALDTFSLEISSTTNGWKERADSTSYINFVQFKAGKGEKFVAKVNLLSSAHYLAKTYRLIVVGAGPYLPAPDITGPHQK